MSNAPTVKTRRGLSELVLATGLASLVCAILHIVTDIGTPVAVIGIVLGIAGLVLGVVALKKRQHKGMAVTGLVAGAFGFLFFLALFVFALVFLGVFLSESPYA